MKIENNEIINALENSVSEAFEEMAFAELDNVKALSSPPTFSSQDIFVSIELRSPVDGWLHMVIQKEYAYDLTMLAIDQPADSELLVGDSIAEMLNTIAGGMMRRLANNMDFEFGLPVFGEVSESPDDLRTSHSSSLLLSFEFGEQKVYVAFKPSE